MNLLWRIKWIMALLFTLLWVLISGDFGYINIALGFAVGFFAMLLIRESLVPEQFFGRIRPLKAIALAGLFLYELVLSAVRVAILVLTPDLKKALRPAIIALPLKTQKDAEITLLANLITLTPGTLSIDVSDDKKYLFIHILAIEDEQTLIEDIKVGFERKIMETFS